MTFKDRSPSARLSHPRDLPAICVSPSRPSLPPDSEQSRWFAEHVLPHEGALRAWLHSRFPSLGDVDDIVQESYERLLRVRETGPVASPRAFLFVSARNFALNQLRRLRRENRVLQQERDFLKKAAAYFAKDQA